MAVTIKIDEITKKMQELYPKIDECRNNKARLITSLNSKPSTIQEFKNVCAEFEVLQCLSELYEKIKKLYFDIPKMIPIDQEYYQKRYKMLVDDFWNYHAVYKNIRHGG